jgi:hypothetical protein
MMKLEDIKPIKKEKKTKSIRLICQTRDLSHEIGTTQ